MAFEEMLGKTVIVARAGNSSVCGGSRACTVARPSFKWGADSFNRLC